MMAEYEETKTGAPVVVDEHELSPNELINASGHVQELDRKFGLMSICGIGIAIDNAWGAGGGALVVALYNGGGPGVIWGLVVATMFYCFIGASLAELASAMPTSANVYHWASVTPGARYGRVCSWFAGWWNCLSWLFGISSAGMFFSEGVMAIYTLYHPGFEPQRWQTFIIYLAFCILESCLVLFGQRILAKVGTGSGTICLMFALVTTLVCAIMPSQTGYGYATNAFVWSEWQNLTGWSNNGLVFLMGVLNGAYAIGTPDGVCHLCEEIPNPRVNIPKGILSQMTTGFLSTLVFYIAILYSVTSLEDIFESTITSLPLAAMYEQATRSTAGTTALLVIFVVNAVATTPGSYSIANRMMWTLARDGATPFASWISEVHPFWRNPFHAQLVCSAVVVVFGCIYIGSEQAFNAFIGVFTIFTTMSYLAAILPHILTRRKNVIPGPFWMPGWWGYLVAGIASAYIVVFNVIFMFPFTMPVSVDMMNWNSTISGGLTILLVLGYLWKRNHGYTGPKVIMDANDNVMEAHIGLDKELTERSRAIEA